MASHPTYRFSGIGRPVDPAYRTNRAILFLLPVALVGGAIRALLAGSGVVDAGLSSANGAVALFLSWALTRELSPDDNAAAFAAAGLAWLGWALAGRQSLMIAVVVLIAVRIVNRSTGKASMPSDTVLLLPLFVFAGWTESWTLAVVGAAAFALDGVLPAAPGQAKRSSHRGIAVLLLAFAAVLVAFGTSGLRADWPVGLVLLLVAVFAAAVGLVCPEPRSCGDVDGLPLVRVRVRAGLLLGVFAAVLVTVDAGVEIARLGVLWSGLAGTVVGWPFLLRRSAQT